jgi:hypothetical protein
LYDGPSLERLLSSAGFVDAETLPPGKTNVPDPGALDLSERDDVAAACATQDHQMARTDEATFLAKFADLRGAFCNPRCQKPPLRSYVVLSRLGHSYRLLGKIIFPSFALGRQKSFAEIL